MYGSPTARGGLFSTHDGRSRAMETDPRVAVQYRGMVLVSARVEGPEMEAPADVYAPEQEFDDAGQHVDVSALNMEDQVDSYQQSACSRIVQQREDNRKAREEAF